ncbi:hypothetical protein GOB04_17710 [Sinorhizobium meliloti]|nr:hypothetical protein [Sinorhizobium meliloti]
MRYVSYIALVLCGNPVQAFALDEFISSEKVIHAPFTGETRVASRKFGSSNRPVTLNDNVYSTLCRLNIIPDGGELLIVGQAVLRNDQYNDASHGNIVVRSAIRILDPTGHHIAISETGSPPADEVYSVYARWLTVHPFVYYRPPAGVPVTFEVAAVTSYHPDYRSGRLVANDNDNPCYISVSEFAK